MISLAKLAANRANAQKSTGPKTPAGKAHVARNGRNSKGPRTAAGKLRSARNASGSTGPRTVPGKRRAAQNAKRSTGPKTEAGKKRVPQNAVRHGLSRPAGCEPDAQSTIADFAQAMTLESGQPELLPKAVRLAAAQFDLLRVRRARLNLFALGPRNTVRRLAALQRYEARARRQRNTAIRDLEDAHDGGVSDSGRNATLVVRDRARWPRSGQMQGVRKQTEPNRSQE
jgi:hypothetical protein